MTKKAINSIEIRTIMNLGFLAPYLIERIKQIRANPYFIKNLFLFLKYNIGPTIGKRVTLINQISFVRPSLKSFFKMLKIETIINAKIKRQNVDQMRISGEGVNNSMVGFVFT